MVVPQAVSASSALNALDDLIVFIAGLIGLAICSSITLIYLLLKKYSKVFAYLLLVLNLGVGLFFLSAHWGIFVVLFAFNVLIVRKMRKRQRVLNKG